MIFIQDGEKKKKIKNQRKKIVFLGLIHPFQKKKRKEKKLKILIENELFLLLYSFMVHD